MDAPVLSDIEIACFNELRELFEKSIPTTMFFIIISFKHGKYINSNFLFNSKAKVINIF
jgi:hypothetical protein